MSQQIPVHASDAVTTTREDACEQSLAVCVPVIERTDDLERLLASVPRYVDEVVIADNGHTDERKHVYDRDYAFDVELVDLAYDAGIGACRTAAAASASTEYVLVCDNDMEIPDSVWRLVAALEAEDSLGGVSGILDEHGSLRSGCCNFEGESLYSGDRALVQQIGSDPPLEWIGGHPIARFDKLTNAAVLRRECVADYSWDTGLKDREHLDFYVGHWRRTEWEFAVCPSVVFRHHTGGSNEYETQWRHGNDDRQQRYREAFLSKWGYDRLVCGDTQWFGTDADGRSPLEPLARTVERALPPRYYVPIKDAVKRLGGGA